MALGAAFLPGCKRPEPAPPAPAAAPPPAPAAAPAPPTDLVVTVSTDATGGAPPAAAPAPPPAPPPPATENQRGATAIEPTQRIPLAPGAEVVVDPQATFEVELSARVADARILLVDARDDMVPAAGSRELSAGTRLTLAPSAPLVPGSRYALRIDGAAERELHDQAGRAFSPLTLPILAAGTPPPPEPKRPPRKKKRR
jgi:hypothetical protein